MTEFYNCLIFLQFFTASFTIVLTPQGCARERIFSMKEQLYTIPLNDAVNAQDECPLLAVYLIRPLVPISMKHIKIMLHFQQASK